MPKPRRIEILTFDDAQLLDVTGPLQVFASANNEAEAAGLPLPYDVEAVAESATVRTNSGLVIVTRQLVDCPADVDTLIVGGGFGVNRAMERASLIDWITTRAKDARRVASVCSGAFLLAEAGLLAGKRAATHWGRVTEFRARFPDVTLDPEPIYIRDGDIWTSAGVTAGIDLALALVEDDIGHAIALAVARELVVFLKRPGGQSQFSSVLQLQSADARFDELNGWIAANLKADLSLAALADRSNMSVRSFARHYALATGQTPARAVEIIRVEAARRMLEARAAVGSVARRCGFGSEETMRRAFQRTLGVPPRDYAARFSLE
jgi:transcriptional regulator GlxA family with amidase domain